MRDYRAEWLNELLVERAVWTADAPVRTLDHATIAGPGYVWFRFWLAEGEYLVEKYFDPQGRSLGMYARVAMLVPYNGRGYRALDLMLGLWIMPSMRVVVYNEREFDASVRSGVIAPAEAHHAEHQIREMTLGIAHKRFPPGLVRNFSVVSSKPAGQGAAGEPAGRIK
jgi:predicted RNA-binding protein associated with RNAse of E/G family